MLVDTGSKQQAFEVLRLIRHLSGDRGGIDPFSIIPTTDPVLPVESKFS